MKPTRHFNAWTIEELIALSHLIKSGKAADGALFQHADQYDRTHSSVKSMSHKLHKTGTWQHWIKCATQRDQRRATSNLSS
ncbi:hypothetical protein QK289_04195 [Exiguobacterium antarcticum]|uniref:Myb-like domain-containing protein n=1 Tax=Exiguobacterium antarcticum TaxID=132920 RepID=A0ABT6QZT5_9BACL|nr:hypothetical protein [Exiguobacterium antarcticum]MDI3234199.1 hypothetical protein [Exiguobacterium antarcticum]